MDNDGSSHPGGDNNGGNGEKPSIPKHSENGTTFSETTSPSSQQGLFIQQQQKSGQLSPQKNNMTSIDFNLPILTATPILTTTGSRHFTHGANIGEGNGGGSLNQQQKQPKPSLPLAKSSPHLSPIATSLNTTTQTRGKISPILTTQPQTNNNGDETYSPQQHIPFSTTPPPTPNLQFPNEDLSNRRNNVQNGQSVDKNAQNAQNAQNGQNGQNIDTNGQSFTQKRLKPSKFTKSIQRYLRKRNNLGFRGIINRVRI
jgi:hypothetical protein